MEPIVNGLKKKYSQCLKLERVNFHASTPWHELLSPIGSPEFALLDSSKQVLYRWFGVVPADEFSAVFDPLCFG
jgi:hypothetical protein